MHLPSSPESGRHCVGGKSEEEVQLFLREATAEDYDHLLETVMRWVDV